MLAHYRQRVLIHISKPIIEREEYSFRADWARPSRSKCIRFESFGLQLSHLLPKKFGADIQAFEPHAARARSDMVIRQYSVTDPKQLPEWTQRRIITQRRHIHFAVTAPLICDRYQSIAISSPRSIEYSGSYPSRRRALLISASEWRTSPGRKSRS